MHTERVAIVTGSSHGIGAATALLLAEEGYRFCVNYRLNETAANEVVSELALCEATAIAVRADVGREDDAVRMFGTVAQELGPAIALLNCGGLCRHRPAWKTWMPTGSTARRHPAGNGTCDCMALVDSGLVR